ncbi:MAG: response regulator [Gaiellaceae bacterium]
MTVAETQLPTGLESDAEPPATARSGTLLLADDEDAMRETAAQMLEEVGYSVIQAKNGSAAFARFRRDPDAFDCLILDLTMPGMNGDEASRAIRELRADAAVVIMSGFNSVVLSTELTSDGIAAFLQKPFTLSELLAAIDRARAQLESAAS